MIGIVTRGHYYCVATSDFPLRIYRSDDLSICETFLHLIKPLSQQHHALTRYAVAILDARIAAKRMEAIIRTFRQSRQDNPGLFSEQKSG